MDEAKEREPLAEAFFQFRLEAPDEIVVPGSVVAHRTVARRKTARTIGLVAVVLLMTAGAGLAFGGNRLPFQPAQPGPSKPAPTLSAEQLDALGVAALAELGRIPGDLRPGVVFGPVDASTSSWTYTLGTTAQPFPAGRYVLNATCRGQGEVTVRWFTTGHQGSRPVPCGAGPVQAQFDLIQPGVIGLELAADEAAQGRAGVAVAVTDPLIITAERALGTAPQGWRTAASGMATTPTRDIDETDVPAGTYRLTVACAGTGAVTATFTIGDRSKDGVVNCTAGGGLLTLDLPAPQGGPQAVVELTAVDPPNVAAFAYRVAVVGATG